MSLVWMSGPLKAVMKDAYTNGPAPWHNFHPDPGDIIIAKDSKGRTIIRETFDGKALNDKFK